MNISQLRQRLTIQAGIRTPDGGGGFETVWQDIATEPVVYAAVIQVSGDESLRQQQRTAAASYRITIRYRADITSAHRLTDGAAIFNITSLRDPDGLRAWLEMTATMP